MMKRLGLFRLPVKHGAWRTGSAAAQRDAACGFKHASGNIQIDGLLKTYRRLLYSGKRVSSNLGVFLCLAYAGRQAWTNSTLNHGLLLACEKG
jgi:hypothetical protein